MNEIEKWVDVSGYEGLYKVSTHGRVLSYHGSGERLLKARDMGRGYVGVTLCRDGQRKNAKIHRLVAEHFIPNPELHPCINHKDENKRNNKVCNLEWCDYSYNNSYGSRPLRQSLKMGKPVVQCHTDGTAIKKWRSILAVERDIGINNSNISGCCRGLRETAGGYIWRYEKECYV